MPPPSDHPCLHLSLLEKKFFVVKTEKLDAAVFSITRTPEEISVAGEVYEGMSKTFEENSGWRCIKIAGPMEFNLTGVVASFTAPLMTAQVPVFAVSTWNADYVLVPDEKVAIAVDALKQDGWVFTEQK
ncbi:hypothetical protein BDZ89DRAFT_1060141 [Hymenopellis radicata]|nr:hypothetical protein BDZ89DRAFT_1060141 [Hymenopellis radicata]